MAFPIENPTTYQCLSNITRSLYEAEKRIDALRELSLGNVSDGISYSKATHEIIVEMTKLIRNELNTLHNIENR